MKLFFNSFNYNHNKSFEKFTSKFMIYVYYLNCCLLVLNLKFENDSEGIKIFDDFFKSFDEYVAIFFKMSENKLLTDFHKELKYKIKSKLFHIHIYIRHVMTIEDSNRLKENSQHHKSELIKLIYSFRIFSKNENSYMNFIKSKK